MFQKSENGESVKPGALEISGDFVIVRRNFEHIDAVGKEGDDDYIPEHWEYEEWQMTKEQYDVWNFQQEEIDRLTEENRFLVYESARHDADIDYCLMLLDE